MLTFSMACFLLLLDSRPSRAVKRLCSPNQGGSRDEDFNQDRNSRRRSRCPAILGRMRLVHGSGQGDHRLDHDVRTATQQVVIQPPPVVALPPTTVTTTEEKSASDYANSGDNATEE